MKNKEHAFFEDLAIQLDSWIETVSKSISDPNADLIWTDSPESFRKIRMAIENKNIEDELKQALKESFQGLLHSVLVTFDGGTALADNFMISIISDDGYVFNRNLHEQFMEYLIDTGRLD